MRFTPLSGGSFVNSSSPCIPINFQRFPKKKNVLSLDGFTSLKYRTGMYTLGFDTTGEKTRLVLLRKNEVDFEREWKSNAKEAETIIKTLQFLTEHHPMLFQRLRRIIAVKGPGGFNGTRIGVTITNSLVWLAKAKVFALDTFTLWKRRLTKAQLKKQPHQMIKMNENEIFFDGKATTFEDLVEKIKKTKMECAAYGHLTPSQHYVMKRIKNFFWIPEEELKTFSLILQELTNSGKTSMISPVYSRDPMITPAKKTLNYAKK